MRALILALALAIASVLLSGSVAAAHEIRPASLKIEATGADGTYDVVWKTPIIAGRRAAISPVLPPACTWQAAGPGVVAGAALIERWQVTCGTQGLAGATLRIEGLERTMIDVVVHIVAADGRFRTLIVKPQRPAFTLGQTTPGDGDPGVMSYFALGFDHLLRGVDHILFVIGLVFLIRTPVTLLKVITAFTVAHSLTLALSATGLVLVGQGAVEAVIALSILFLGVELARSAAGGDPGDAQSLLMRYPWALTFVFGLLHGFGFAGALADIGLPAGQATVALLLFNLGVEAGQLLIVGAVLGVLAAGRGLRVRVPPALKLAPAYGIGVAASVWFIDRTLMLFPL